ncbi:MAG: HAD family hydrolase [Patescibacteria group bacterium]|nr:HAD family hydrolase [Patescibacteria group bacterium]
MTKRTQDYSQILEEKRDELSKIKGILVDIDGTLVDLQKYFSEESKLMVKRVEQTDLVLGLCTGRSYPMIKKYILPNFSQESFHVLEDGGQIITSNGQVEYEKKIESNLVREICTIARQVGGEFGLTVGETVYYSQNFYDFIKNKDSWDLDMAPASELKNWATTCINLFNISNESLDKILQMLDKTDLNIVKCKAKKLDDGDFANVLHLTAPGVNKGTTAEAWAKIHGLSLSDEIMMFGDGYNDDSVMKKVALGIAMGNAVPELKKATDFVIGHVDDDSLPDFINQFLDKRRSWFLEKK